MSFSLYPKRIYGPFFFSECTVTCVVYPDMVKEFLVPISEKEYLNGILQRDGAPPHFDIAV
jgi:hypothetical protein